MSRLAMLLLALLSSSAAVGWVSAARAEPPPPAGGVAPSESQRQQLRAQVGRLVDQLDSDRFSVRQRAARQMEQLLTRPELGRVLAAEFQRILLHSDVSFEVRSRLERWQRQLPQVDAQPAGNVPPAELDRFVAELDDDSYAVRVAARQRIEWLLTNPRLVYPVMTRLKQRLSDPGLRDPARRQIEGTWQRARALWLLSDSAQWDLPPVSEGQIAEWIEQLAQPAPDDDGARPGSGHRTARRELLDVLTRDDHVERVRQALAARMAGLNDARAVARLRELLDLCRPAMVAEYWNGSRHLGEQHLLIGVPNQSANAVRPSLFDYCDDERAHCASGNNLSPGDYPVGVAFPHPNQEGAAFHLVNLSTPRRRMAYALYIKTDEATRLSALSRRTLERLLRRRRPLAEAEMVMFEQLPIAEVSRFAGKYVHLVDDEPLPPSGPLRYGGRPSRHGMLAGLLAVRGTKEAMPELLEAIETGRFLPPTSLAPYRLDYLAALSIAARDPWPQADEWLFRLIDRNDPLIQSRPEGPELGATAAGLLLKRHGRLFSEFGLAPAGDREMLKLNVTGYRFHAPDSRPKVREWWQQHVESRKKES